MSDRTFNRAPGMARVAERQMRFWELARAQNRRDPEHVPPKVEDFVAVSRMVGLESDDTAVLLGERLHWPVLDREILTAMADDDRVREQLYASMDERGMGWCEESFRSLMHSEFVKNDYFHRLCRTVLSLARQGNAVFVGRGVDRILPADRGLRVRLIAPMSWRVARVAAEQKIPEGRAALIIQRNEEERAVYFLRHFGVDENDPVRHHLLLNRAALDADTCVASIMTVLERRRQTPDRSTEAAH